MINFIACEDNKVINKNVVDVISKVMMKNKLHYKTHTFLDYNSDFNKLVKKSISSKIYILDIRTPSGNGIEIAREIREKDGSCIIIFLTSHEKMASTIIQSEIMPLVFICKKTDYEAKLESAINSALNILNERSVIKFSDKGGLYTIPMNDILYFTMDSIERKCVLKTEYGEFKLTKSLTQMGRLLSNDFVQSHRACIINSKRVLRIKFRQKEVLFDTGEIIDLVSGKFRNNIMKFAVDIEIEGEQHANV